MRGRLRAVRETRDRGAYAILFAALVIVLVGTASVVVDLALLRESRAQTRSAADAAVMAAASSLNVIDPAASNPRAACQDAWAYLMVNLGDLPDGTSSCDTLPTTASGCTTSSPAQRATATSAGWTVRVTWPVPAGDTLMTTPDSAPATVTQAARPTVDGDQCSRMAVEVLRTNRLAFAGALGVGESTTRAASVGRSVVDGLTSSTIAALNVLEPTRCDVLVTSGQGSIRVEGSGGSAGVIAVESSATAGAPSCNGANKAAISPSSSSLNFISVDGPGGPGTGFLQSYALNAAPTGNPAKAYVNESNLAPNPPTPLPARFGAKPVTDIFNCTSATCADGGGPWVNDLRTSYGGSGPTAPAGFQTLPGPAVPAFVCSQTSSSPVAVVPAGRWFINCPTMSVATTVVFQGGTIVTRGGISLGNGSSCLAVNVNGSTCPTVVPATATAPVTTAPAPAGDAVLYLRSGDLSKGSQASLFMPRTFTYIHNGVTTLGGGSGTLLWTTPLADSCAATDLVCQAKKFSKLVLWSESSSLHSLGGQSALALRGTLYTPNAASEFVGQGGSQQTDAQFWTRTLEVKGQGTLKMVADPDASIARPSNGVALIR